MERACPYLVQLLTVCEVYSLLHGELRTIELTVPGASKIPTVELPGVRGYHGHSLTYLLTREVWNLLLGRSTLRRSKLHPSRVSFIGSMTKKMLSSLTAASTMEIGAGRRLECV